MSSSYNFVLFFPDQWRGDCLGALGHPVVETPYLDHISAEGITFTSAYSAAPTCIPSRACLATGQRPTSHGRIGYQDGVPWRYKDTLMKCLRDGGYQTLQAGKTHFFPQRAALGFEEMRLYEIPIHHPDFESDYHTWLERETQGMVRDTAREVDPNTWVVNPWTHSINLHSTTWIADSALELLARRDTTRPFFLQVGFHRPHAPYDPPLSYFNMYQDKELPGVPVGDWAENRDTETRDLNCWEGKIAANLLDRVRRAYYAHISHIDYQIGRIYNWLKKNKLLENTCIIFASDHGELLGDHNLFRKAKPFEGSAKIPLIIHPPHSIEFERGIKNDLPVTHMDIMPTILEMAEKEIPGSVEGISLNSVIRGERPEEREYIHGEHANGGEGWQYLTDGREKYIWETKSGNEMFFDLREDPGEIVNLVNNERYKQRIEIWRKRLIDVLSQRPDDGLVDEQGLSPGKVLPKVRGFLRS